MGDYDKIINEEEEYEAEDADDLKEQENAKEFEDVQGENTAAREMQGKEREEENEGEEVEGRLTITYSKKKKLSVKKTKKTKNAKKTKKVKKTKKAKKKKPAKRGKRKR